MRETDRDEEFELAWRFRDWETVSQIESERLKTDNVRDQMSVGQEMPDADR